MTNGEKVLKEQISYLLGQLRTGNVSVHEFMKLLEMMYGDYLDFHPEERPDWYDRSKLDEFLKQTGPSAKKNTPEHPKKRE